MAEERDDVEVEWARIVAGYDREVDDAVSRWPVEEDLLDPPAGTDATDRRLTDPSVSRLDPRPAGDEPPDSFDRAADLPGEAVDAGAVIDRETGHDTEHHYVPPEPPPLPRPDLPTGLAWAGVLGGPILMLLAAVLAWDLPRLLTAVCVVGFVGGMVFLVATMDDGGRDGWDDGAQV